MCFQKSILCHLREQQIFLWKQGQLELATVLLSACVRVCACAYKQNQEVSNFCTFSTAVLPSTLCLTCVQILWESAAGLHPQTCLFFWSWQDCLILDQGGSTQGLGDPFWLPSKAPPQPPPTASSHFSSFSIFFPCHSSFSFDNGEARTVWQGERKFPPPVAWACQVTLTAQNLEVIGGDVMTSPITPITSAITSPMWWRQLRQFLGLRKTKLCFC